MHEDMQIYAVVCTVTNFDVVLKYIKQSIFLLTDVEGEIISGYVVWEI